MVRGRGRPKKNNNSKIQEPDSESAQEEYEVERVESHQIVGKGKNAKLEYLVKWKNYPASDNTWEPVESVENAHQLVDDYWSTRGGEKQREQVIKQLQGGNKASATTTAAPAAATPAKAATKTAAKATVKAAVKEDKPESKKRRASSRTVVAPTTTTTITTNSRKRAKASTPEVSDIEENIPKPKETLCESEGEVDISDSEVENENFRFTKSWNNIDKVKYFERDEENNQMYAIVSWKDGKLAKYKTSDLAKKAPLKLIEFYENNLSFEED